MEKPVLSARIPVIRLISVGHKHRHASLLACQRILLIFLFLTRLYRKADVQLPFSSSPSNACITQLTNHTNMSTQLSLQGQLFYDEI